MKRILKLTCFLLLGMLLGMAGFVFSAVLFTDITFAEFIGKFQDLKIMLLLSSVGLSLICFFLVGYLQIILHEAGHLLFGLLTGYQFVSFRIGNLVLIRENGKYIFKHFKIPGTAGQCLLLPPEGNLQRSPFALYNLGGILFNLLSAIVATCLLVSIDAMPIIPRLLCLFTAIIGFAFALINGIPLKMAGVPNDGYNLWLMYREPESRKALLLQLKMNALVQEGIRLKDMPSEWFADETEANYNNALKVCVKGFCLSRLIDRKEFEQAKELAEELLVHQKEILPLFAKEATCELLYLKLIGECRPDKIDELYTKEIKQHIKQYEKISTGKQRLNCALALYQDKNPKEAQRIYEEVCHKRNNYLMKAETESDIELMEWMLHGIKAKL